MQAACSVCHRLEGSATGKLEWLHCVAHRNQMDSYRLSCLGCATGWRCPICNAGANMWRVLSLDLDMEGLPLAQDIGPDDAPPPRTMKFIYFTPMLQVVERYSLFRFESLVSEGRDPSLDPFLQAHAPPGILKIKTTGFAKATDSMRQQVIDTFAPPRIDPRPLRVMSWNLQDLGGGPSRGPKRSQDSINRIATVIAEVRPDICAILEVKLSGRKPSEPELPIPPKQTRNRTDLSTLEQEFDARKKAYIKDYAAYLVKLQDWKDASASGQAPGVAELDRILQALLAIDSGGSWALLIDKNLHTVGEAYAFFYRCDAVQPRSWEVLSKWEWPTAGYRHPARVTFHLFGRCARPGLVDTPFDLDVIAFHAPAPDHGEDVFKALACFKQIPWPRETVFAGDFNIDTELGDSNHMSRYPDEFDPYDTGFDDAFDQWSDLAFNLRLDKARESFEDLFAANLTGSLKSLFGSDQWLAGIDLERTSLRTSIVPAKAEHWEMNAWMSTLAFQNAAYDKIMLMTPNVCNPKLLQAVDARAYPLFERFLPSSLHPHFVSFVQSHADRNDSLTVTAANGSPDVAVQSVLTAVKDISDHVPVVLYLQVHPDL